MSIGVHVGTGVRDVGGMEFPGRAVGFLGLLPPTLRDDDVDAAVAVDVAVAQAVRESAGAGDHLAFVSLGPLMETRCQGWVGSLPGRK